MQPCPQCAQPNPAGAPDCSRCGAPLVKATGRLGAQTLLGMPQAVNDELDALRTAGGLPQEQSTGASTPEAAQLKRTLLGVQAPQAQPTPPPGAAPSESGAPFDAKRTLIGGALATAPQASLQPTSEPFGKATRIGLPSPPPAASMTPLEPLTTSHAPGSILHPGGESASVGSTLLGMPAPDSTALGATNPLPRMEAAWATQGAGLSPLEPDPTGAQRTLMGVATPGIAPLNPGVPKVESIPAPDETVPLTETAQARVRGASILLGAAALLILALGVFWALWTPTPPLSAQVRIDAQGRETLEVTCADCPPGSLVSVGEQRASFRDQTALLELTEPLNIGSNALTVALERSGIGRNETLVLEVPVHFRIALDSSQLGADVPRLGVVISASPGTQVEIDAQPVELESGRGQFSYEPGDALWGLSTESKFVERELNYRVVPPNETARQGTFTLRAPIAPLSLEAPGPSIVTEAERFVMSGATVAGGRVQVSGRPLSVEASGHFTQLMSIDAVGETTIVVRADATDHLPRMVRVGVKRVKDLAVEADHYRAGAKTDYQEVLRAAQEQKAEPAALAGKVEHVRVAGHSTALLLDVERGCTSRPCWARVVYQQRFPIAQGAYVEALGVIRSTVAGPGEGQPIPELQAAFLLARDRKSQPQTQSPAR